MATTISGPSVTDDTGTPSSPNEDGTLINASFFTSFYAAINAMWSGATQVFDGVLTVAGFGTHTFSAGGTGTQIVAARNTTAGATNAAQFRLGHDSSEGVSTLTVFSTTFSATGDQVQNGARLNCVTAGGLNLSASHASGVVRFYAGGTTLRHSIDTTGAFNFQAGLRLNNIISPSQLTANTDNWNPSGLSTANIIRASSDAARNLTGISAQSTGRMILLFNVGSFNIVLVHDATSTAANRFYCPGSANITLSSNDCTTLVYDGTDSRWRVVDLPNAT